MFGRLTRYRFGGDAHKLCGRVVGGGIVIVEHVQHSLRVVLLLLLADVGHHQQLVPGLGHALVGGDKENQKQGSGAGYSVGPHSGRLELLWSTMKI